MRAVFIGASSLTRITAAKFIEAGHEVVLIEKDEAIIKQLNEELDCSLVHGDGSKPHVLEDVDPASSDILFCLSDDDNDNIIAAVVARSMDFKQVVLRIEDPESKSICEQLQLDNVIVPDERVAKHLQEFAEGERNEPEEDEDS